MKVQFLNPHNLYSKMKYGLRIVLLSVFIWLSICDVALLNVPSIFSFRKLIFVVLVIYFLVKYKTIYFQTCHTYFLLFMIVVFLYSAMLILVNKNNQIGGNDLFISYLGFFILWGMIEPVFVQKVFKDIDEFLLVVIIAMIIEALSVYGSQFSEAFRIFLKNTFVDTGNIDYLSQTRARGICSEGATLSMQLYLGMTACGYFIIKKQNVGKYAFFFAILAGACFLAGRTGLYFGIILIVLLFIKFVKKHKGVKITKVVLYLSGGSFLLVLPFMNIINDSQWGRLDRLYDRVLSSFENGIRDDSISHFLSMQIPGISTETIIGTGITNGLTQNGVRFRHDGGYIKMYFAMGIILAAVFYIFLLIFLIKMIRKIADINIKKYLTFFSFTIFLAEVKEPFILGRSCIMFFLLSWILIMIKTQEQKNVCVETYY